MFRGWWISTVCFMFSLSHQTWGLPVSLPWGQRLPFRAQIRKPWACQIPVYSSNIHPGCFWTHFKSKLILLHTYVCIFMHSTGPDFFLLLHKNSTSTYISGLFFTFLGETQVREKLRFLPFLAKLSPIFLKLRSISAQKSLDLPNKDSQELRSKIQKLRFPGFPKSAKTEKVWKKGLYYTNHADRH